MINYSVFIFDFLYRVWVGVNFFKDFKDGFRFVGLYGVGLFFSLSNRDVNDFLHFARDFNIPVSDSFFTLFYLTYGE